MTMLQPARQGWWNSVLLGIGVALVVVAASSMSFAGVARAERGASDLRGAIIDPAGATSHRLSELASAGTNTAVLMLSSSESKTKTAIRIAAVNAQRAGLDLAYWIEVARSPELADEHPRWMASLQTHEEWRRLFPETAKPGPSEVAKTYPWVPILARAPFEAQRKRLLKLLAEVPAPKLIFLNDLQGAPSACGCGNSLCRWTSDYGPRRSTTPLDDNAAALFIREIQTAAPDSEVIPVWTTECEEHDGSPDGLCAGVGCYDGLCWRAYTRQLMPVAETSRRLAVLALYQEFQRDLPHYGPAEASWIEYAVGTFQTMPPRHRGKAIPASRMIAVVQGWDVSADQIEAQRSAAKRAGAAGSVVAYAKIDQSWTPKIVSWK